MKQISQTIPYKGMIKSIGKRMEVSGAYPIREYMWMSQTCWISEKRQTRREM